MSRMNGFLSALAGATFLAACTGQLPGTFRYAQQLESFATQQQLNLKIDLLWVVDNSSSMDISQKALREKLAGFSQRYMKPYWDIRVAVITTDTYLANPVFNSYLNSTVASAGYRSYNYAQFINARGPSDPQVQKLATHGVSTTGGTPGTFTLGLKFKELVPAWGRGADYARLVPGIHDGPIAAFCMERLSYFLADDDRVNYPLKYGPQCKIRDAGTKTGIGSCLNPTGSEDSVSQCVNTVLNDTVHSGLPILATKPSAGTLGDAAWVQQLVSVFSINVSKGSTGSGSERGFASVIEFLDQNEGTSTKFFRPDALRGIVFVTDEDDQTMNLPALGSVPGGFKPETDYKCDLESLVAANSAKFGSDNAARTYITTTYGYCCTGGGCLLENLGCPTKTVDGLSYRVGVCPTESKLMSVSSFKQRLDDFFTQLDTTQGSGVNAGNPNYFVVAIVPTTASGMLSLQAARYQSDDQLDILPFYINPTTVTTQQRLRLPAVDQGTRYLELVSAVGAGSLSADIASADYASLLDKIGLTMVQKKSVFPLNFEPTNKNEILVVVFHKDGTQTEVPESKYEIEGRSVRVTDVEFVLTLADTDIMAIDYQPASLE